MHTNPFVPATVSWYAHFFCKLKELSTKDLKYQKATLYNAWLLLAQDVRNRKPNRLLAFSLISKFVAIGNFELPAPQLNKLLNELNFEAIFNKTFEGSALGHMHIREPPSSDPAGTDTPQFGHRDLGAVLNFTEAPT